MIPFLSYTAIALSLTLAIASGTGDYALIVPMPHGLPTEVVCTKSQRDCEASREAIRRGWFMREIPSDTPTLCQAWPNCFNEQSNCIKGYSC